MLRFTIRFPLGVYHAQATQSFDEPEWPPSPLRLVGALLAAAYRRPDADPTEDRALLQRLCEAAPPSIHAPASVDIDEPVAANEVVRLRGVTRWAPRNYVQDALSPRNLGRERAPVSKVGVAIGDRAVHVVWRDVDVDEHELARLAVLASDVTFLGTTRSPALVEVARTAPSDCPHPVWTPVDGDGDGVGAAVLVRVPDAQTIADFDRRHAARHSTKTGVQSGGMVPGIWVGREVRFAHAGRGGRADAVDPRWWGDMIVLAVDRPRSEVVPKAPAAYLLARAARVALLGAYDDRGTHGEAPPILTARGGDPHCAIVPLPHVWGEHATGNVLGVAIVLPHPRRVPDVAEQRVRVEHGLRRLVVGHDDHAQRFLSIPSAGTLWLAIPDAAGARKVTLREASYRRPSRRWVTVTPVVHSRWRKGGENALLDQVAADCAHVGLPAPERVEVLRTAGRRGGAHRLVSIGHVPEQWRGPLQGPADHLAITFSQPVCGPVLLGRARHFGVGLLVPDLEATSNAAQEAA